MSIDLAAIRLDRGSHSSPDDGHCLLEVVSMLAGTTFTDQPSCVSPVLRAYGIALNDAWDADQRQKLLPFAPRLLNTADDGQDEARSFLALDWLIRTFTPAWLDVAGLTETAGELRSLRRIADMAAVNAAEATCRKVQQEASAARSAARSAAWSAARSAAWSAARSAARSAAESAAESAAWSAVQPTVELLQASALDLFDAMIDPAAVTA